MQSADAPSPARVLHDALRKAAPRVRPLVVPSGSAGELLDMTALFARPAVAAAAFAESEKIAKARGSEAFVVDAELDLEGRRLRVVGCRGADAEEVTALDLEGARSASWGAGAAEASEQVFSWMAERNGARDGPDGGRQAAQQLFHTAYALKVLLGNGPAFARVAVVDGVEHALPLSVGEAEARKTVRALFDAATSDRKGKGKRAGKGGRKRRAGH